MNNNIIVVIAKTKGQLKKTGDDWKNLLALSQIQLKQFFLEEYKSINGLKIVRDWFRKILYENKDSVKGVLLLHDEDSAIISNLNNFLLYSPFLLLPWPVVGYWCDVSNKRNLKTRSSNCS